MSNMYKDWLYDTEQDKEEYVKVLSKHFKREEFACKCGCGFDAVDTELLDVLEDVREMFGPTHISSACRCLEHNTNIGSKNTSQHVRAKAADITCGLVPKTLYLYLDAKYRNKYGLGLYPGFVHVDVRDVKARWVG